MNSNGGNPDTRQSVQYGTPRLHQYHVPVPSSVPLYHAGHDRVGQSQVACDPRFCACKSGAREFEGISYRQENLPSEQAYNRHGIARLNAVDSVQGVSNHLLPGSHASESSHMNRSPNCYMSSNVRAVDGSTVNVGHRGSAAAYGYHDKSTAGHQVDSLQSHQNHGISHPAETHQDYNDYGRQAEYNNIATSHHDNQPRGNRAGRLLADRNAQYGKSQYYKAQRELKRTNGGFP